MVNRLDNELVKRKIFSTRNKAQNAIDSGLVFCDGKKITKSGYKVDENTLIEIKGDIMPYVSRGGLKLEKALKSFNISLTGKTMLDIGSSTGGFTDCALKNDVKKVIAIDVGTNQMDETLKQNPKVKLYEKTDFRDMDPSIIDETDIATIDVSFISVIKLILKLSEITNLKEIVCLIKPQFECGKDIADKYKGVILNRSIHVDVIDNIINEFKKSGFTCRSLTSSPIRGGNGNIEYLAYFKKDSSSININSKILVKETFDNFEKINN